MELAWVQGCCDTVAELQDRMILSAYEPSNAIGARPEQIGTKVDITRLLVDGEDAEERERS